jgi:hypothetical protein
MKIQSRRKFIAVTAMLSTILTSSALISKKINNRQLVHHVFFWLKNPESKEDLKKLVDGARKLAKIETVRQIHIGIPAETPPRPIIDTSYSASLLLFFDDLPGQDFYQIHALHQKFIEDCSPLWEKVIVYDIVDL